MIMLWILTALMALVIYYDARYYIIPNWLNLSVIALYGAFFLLHMPNPWWGGFAAMGIMFTLGMGMFALGIMGGGDVKLLTALMLWMGWNKVSLAFILYFSLAGGVLAVFIIMLRRMILPLIFHGKMTAELPRIFVRNQPIPYGIAIAGAFLLLLHTGQVSGVRF